MFSVLSNSFDEHLQLVHTIDNLQLSEYNARYFDNDGFELTTVEFKYYERHGIDSIYNGILNHTCDQRPWIVCKDERFIVDHSIILQRWEFAGEARQQLIKHKTKIPQLTKFLNIIPKWGIDFALDYYDNEQAFEVLHVENDYRTYDDAMRAKQETEQRILNTDWNDFAASIVNHKDEWVGLTGFAQNDWKARYWGLPKAEVTEKAFL